MARGWAGSRLARGGPAVSAPSRTEVDRLAQALAALLAAWWQARLADAVGKEVGDEPRESVRRD